MSTASMLEELARRSSSLVVFKTQVDTAVADLLFLALA